MYMLMHYY